MSTLQAVYDVNDGTYRYDTAGPLREWATFRIRDRRPTALTWIGRVLLLVGGVWLTGHLAFGWWSF